VQSLSIDLFGYRDDEWGSTFRYFLPNIAAAQLARGDRPSVHLLSSDHRAGHTDVVDGVTVVFHPSVEPHARGGVEHRFGRQHSLSLLRALRAADADVVHFHGARSMQAPLAAVVARTSLQRLPVVAQDHGPRSVGPVTRALHRAALRRCDALLAANDESRAELRSIAPDVEVVLAPNGVDPAVFHPDEDHRHRTDPFRVLVVSRLMPDKDPVTAAEAIAALAGRGHRVDVTVVGAGALRSTVEARLRAAGIVARMVEKLPQPELAAEYRRAHVLVLSSLREGFNQATLEAMASGTPVVASDIPGVRDGVEGAGLLAPAGDVVAFAAHLEQLTDPGQWADRRRRSLERSARFTWPAIVTDLDAAYRRAIQRKRLRA
jgi:glycosyltransferase involved in cell wall biosynthesis